MRCAPAGDAAASWPCGVSREQREMLPERARVLGVQVDLVLRDITGSAAEQVMYRNDWIPSVSQQREEQPRIVRLPLRAYPVNHIEQGPPA